MGDRFLLWLGAGAVCAGVTVGMLAGAGTASAQTESEGAGGAKTSQSTNSTENKQDSSDDESSARRDATPGFGRDAVKAINAVKDAVNDAVTKVVTATRDGDRAAVTQSNVRTTARPEQGQRAELVNNVIAAVTPGPDRKVVIDRTRQRDPVEKVDPVDTVDTNLKVEKTLANRDERSVPVEKSPEIQLVRNVRETLFAPKRANLSLAAPMLAQPQAAATASPQIDVPPVISAIGTAVFNLISFGEGLIEGPPKALPGSGVTVKRSTLTIGDQEVPADWYFPDTYDPESDTPPERIIYLQHGFLARGVFYDYTASYLAESTNSVVVAPTLTSNIFATDGMWLGGTQMHRAVADLFLEGNPALLDSAHAAGYTQDQLPQNVVLVGHSLGGGLVIDVAGMMAADERSDNPTSSYKLAGVVMLDGVSFTEPVPILEGIPADIPVYNLSSTPNPWNLFGSMDHALAEVRGDDFHGAQLFGSWHSDAMVGGNPLIQLGAYLLTGYGGPANVTGSQILAAGWINDMFEPTTTPVFQGPPGSTIKIPTPFGLAVGLVQPTPGPVTSLAREVTAGFFGLLAHINFATDVPATRETGLLV
jgi:hypothetical protein